VLDNLAKQEGRRRDMLENLQHRQNLAELSRRLRTMHAADIAYVLESMPPADRLTIWEQVSPEQAGEVFVELSTTVRQSLVEHTPREALLAMLTRLDSDDLGYVWPSLPQDVHDEVTRSLQSADRSVFEEAIQYPAGTVGHHMSRELTDVPESNTVGDVLTRLRGQGHLPPQTDHLFVVDGRRVLRGTVPLPMLLIHEPATPLTAILRDDIVVFNPRDDVNDAVTGFERYDLVSAPVADVEGRLIGRLTVDAVVDYIRQRSAESRLAEAGLQQEEDVFAPVLDSFKNRWAWLALNLVTAFIASRVIGAFEESIARLVALAALMPIVAGIGGNSGNQTVTMIVRALALGQIQGGTWLKLLGKEIGVALLNGAVWGTLLGVMAYAFYDDVALGGVMALAMMLNFVLAAVMGVAIPWSRARFGRDPALGSSVLITAVTDSGGFFIFLGLATLMLV
jgi:magnesium transporter